MIALKVAVIVVLGYLIGNINFALIISRIKNRDVRKSDSGNPGAMNMLRNFGKGLGALTLILDALKGVCASLLGYFVYGENEFLMLGENQLGIFIGGLSAILGHIYPMFLKFKGGKGISTTIGVCFVIAPLMTLISLIAGVIFIIIFKMGAITSFIIITPPIAYKAFFMSQNAISPNNIIAPVILLFILLLTIYKHRGNIKRLFLGTENKTVLFKRKKD